MLYRGKAILFITVVIFAFLDFLLFMFCHYKTNHVGIVQYGVDQYYIAVSHHQ